jgi:hypothetical protein
VGLPVFFALELEDAYKHSSGAHRALAFPDFLIGLGLEAYRKRYRQKEAPNYCQRSIRVFREPAFRHEG